MYYNVDKVTHCSKTSMLNNIHTVSTLVIIQCLQAGVFHQPYFLKQRITHTSSFHLNMAIHLPQKCQSNFHNEAQPMRGPCSLKDNVYLL